MTRLALSALVASVFGLGCSSAPAPKPNSDPNRLAIPKGAAAQPSASAEKPAAPPADPFDVPAAEVACAFQGHGWAALSLKEDGIAAINVDWSDLSLVVKRGDEPTGVVRVTNPHVTLRGFVDVSAIDFYSNSPLAIGGFVHTTPDARFAVLAGEAGLLRVTTPAGDSWKPRRPLARAVRCNALQPRWTKHGHTASPDGVGLKGTSSRRLIAADQTFELRKQPTGPVVATLRYAADDTESAKLKKPTSSTEALSFETVNGFTHVYILDSPVNLFGWIPSGALRVPKPDGDGVAMGSLSGVGMGSGGASRPQQSALSCGRPVRLFATAENKTLEIGLVKANQAMLIESTLGEYHIVNLTQYNVSATAGAVLQVKVSQTTRCDRVMIAAPWSRSLPDANGLGFHDESAMR